MRRGWIFAWLLTVAQTTAVSAGERLNLENVPAPAPLVAEEPLARSFSLESAARSLDIAALHWQKTRKCAACHTMVPYLMARPTLAAVSPEPPEVRRFFETIVAQPLEAIRAGSPELVGAAAALAFHDRAATGKLNPLTRQALDRMWTLQRPDGSFVWPTRDGFGRETPPPLKGEDHFGVTIAALGASVAPENYAESVAAQNGITGIRKYLKAHPPTSLHQKGMLLWTSMHVADLLSPEEKTLTVKELAAAQRPDGGWSMASLIENPDDPHRQTEAGRNARAQDGHGKDFLIYVGQDDIYKSSLASDGYATGFVVYVLRQAGVSADESRIQRSVAWLKSHQRESGRWFTPSQVAYTDNLIANAGTAFAVLALHACGEIPVPQPDK